MKKLPTVASSMSPFPYSIHAQKSVADAATMMKEHDIHHLPVTEGNDLVGVISKSQVKMIAGPFSNRRDDNDIMVSDVCSQGAVQIDIRDTLEYALELMVKHPIEAILVTKQERLAGILTYKDACKQFAKLLRELREHPDGSDAA